MSQRRNQKRNWKYFEAKKNDSTLFQNLCGKKNKAEFREKSAALNV